MPVLPYQQFIKHHCLLSPRAMAISAISKQILAVGQIVVTWVHAVTSIILVVTQALISPMKFL